MLLIIIIIGREFSNSLILNIIFNSSGPFINKNNNTFKAVNNIKLNTPAQVNNNNFLISDLIYYPSPRHR